MSPIYCTTNYGYTQSVLQCACHSFLCGLEDTFSFTFTISKLKTRLQLNPSFPKVYKSLDLWLNKNIKRYLTLFPWKHNTLAPTIVTADSASEGPWVMCIKTMYNLKFVKRPSQYKRNLRSPSSAHLILYIVLHMTETTGKISLSNCLVCNLFI